MSLYQATDKFECRKIDYLSQTLTLGLACQFLGQLTNTDAQDWLTELIKKTNLKISSMSLEQREKIIEEYINASADTSKSIYQIRV